MRPLSFLIVVVAMSAVSRAQTGEWPTYHGHPSGNRHSPLSDINTSNIADLVPKWTFPIA